MDEVAPYDLIIVGGGIAGVTCAQTIAFLQPDLNVLLISASPLIKAVVNYKQLTRNLEQFDVKEEPISYLETQYPSIKVIHAVVTEVNSSDRLVKTNNQTYKYRKLCLTAGGRPKIISDNSLYVLGIRDTESVETFQKKIVGAKRVMIVGNGGIATELVHELENVQIIWAIKDESITATFVDVGAAQFFLSSINDEKPNKTEPVKREKYTMAKETASAGKETVGSALGPDWHTGYDLKGSFTSNRSVHIEYTVEIKRLLSREEFLEDCNLKESLPLFVAGSGGEGASSWPVYVELNNGSIYGCDFILSATGVIPSVEPFMKGNNFNISNDGGILVDDKMKTSVSDIFAAGDICTPSWEPAPHWLQMRLWTQARQMGIYAGKCIEANILEHEISLDFCFELFTHVTQFFGYKVVLLGKFNAQNLGNDYHALVRCTKGKEYIKVVMQNGRMQGAILIGETDLEETFENLILNQMDLSRYGEDLLHPDIDIEDYFD